MVLSFFQLIQQGNEHFIVFCLEVAPPRYNQSYKERVVIPGGIFLSHAMAFLQKSLDKSGNFVYNNPYKERVVILGADPALIVAAIRAGLFFWYYPQANYITSAFKNL